MQSRIVLNMLASGPGGIYRLRSVIRTFLQLVVLLLPAQWVLAQTTVNVGAYNFPPFITQAESEQPTGLLIELLTLLNQEQTEFDFILVPTSVTRRYQDLGSGRFDLILFESADWGWQSTAHQSLDMAIEDSGVYVAKVQPGRDQHYFDTFTGKRMALSAGFHYQFAGFNADRDTLRQRYEAHFSYSQESNLLRVLYGRSDITVVSQSFLASFIAGHPASAEQFLVANEKEQTTRFEVLLRPGSPISVEQMSSLVSQLRDNGKLSALLQKYHLQTTD